MKNYIKIGLLTVLPGLLMAQGGIRNQGAIIKVSSDAQVKIIHGGIRNQNNGILLNDGEIQLTEDWIQEGNNSNYLGSGTLSFVGQANQQLLSTSTLTVSSLIVDNGHRLILGNDLNVKQQLDLTHNGLVELGAHNLRMASSAVIENYDQEYYILTNKSGFLQQEVSNTPVFFPVGNKTYNPVRISNLGLSDHYQVKVEDQTDQTEAVVNRTWRIEEMVKGGSLVSLDLQWNKKQELPHFNRNQSAIYEENSNFPTVYKAASLNGSSWSQTIKNITDLSSFTVNSAHTILESQSKLEETKTILIFPNPVLEYINIRLEEKVETVFIQIFDAKGSLILQTRKATGNQDFIQLNNLQYLIEGIYSIQVTTENQTTTQQFVKG